MAKKNTPLSFDTARLGMNVTVSIPAEQAGIYAINYPDLAREMAMSNDGNTIADFPAQIWILQNEAVTDYSDRFNPKEIVVPKLFVRLPDHSLMQVLPENCAITT